MVGGEILAGPERRRRWSSEEKRSIVSAAFAPGAIVREVARRSDVTPSLIYRWRRDLAAASRGFAEVVITPAGEAVMDVPGSVELEFPGNVRARISASVPPSLAAAVVEALARR